MNIEDLTTKELQELMRTARASEIRLTLTEHETVGELTSTKTLVLDPDNA